MMKSTTLLLVVFSSLLLLSNSANPPDGMTGAPGDSLCVECHLQNATPLNGTISVEGFPASITPGQSYPLTIVNRNTAGDAAKGGFQVTILGPFNTKAGEMKNPSASSKVTNTFSGRQYFEHNPAPTYPDSNVLRWTVDWIAPEMEAGSTITWYAAGNITNGNFMNSGDRVVTANGNGTIVLSANEEIAKEEPKLYPNPGSTNIQVVLPDGTVPNGYAQFYTLHGQVAGVASITEGKLSAPELSNGVYILEIKANDRVYVTRWSKM
jgi:hypothetical protein